MAGIASWFLGSGGAPRGLLLVANKGDHTLGVVDPAAGKELAAVTESGVTGHEVAASPDGRFAYVPIYGNSGVGAPGSNGDAIDVIDVRARKRLKTVKLDRAVRPHCAIYGPDGLLYVTAELARAVYVFDPHTMKKVGSISTEQKESHMLAISTDGRRGYTSNVGAGSVTALDLVRRRPLAVIPVAKLIQRVSITPNSRWVFTADQHAPRIAVIDAKANKLSRWIPLPAVAFGTRVTLDGRWLMATLPGEDRIAVISLKPVRVVRTIDVPKAPQEILIRPDGRVACVSCDTSRQIAVIDLANWKVQKLVRAGRNCDGLAWAPRQA